MKDILTAPWMVEMIRTVTNMYGHGWDERNGGNVSLLLEESQVKEYVDSAVLREIPTGFSCPELDGKVLPRHRYGQVFQECPVCAGDQSRPRASDGRRRDGAASVGLCGRREIHVRISGTHDEPCRTAENRPAEPRGHALPSGKPACHDLRPQLGRKGLYPYPMADVHGVHRRLSGRRERAAVDALRHQRDR